MASYANGMWTFTAPNCPNCVRTRTAQGFPAVPDAELGELCALCTPLPWTEGVTSTTGVPSTVPDVDMEAVAAAVAGVFEAPVEAAASEPTAEAAGEVAATQVDVEVQ